MNVKIADLVKIHVFTDYVENLHRTNTIEKQETQKDEHDTCNRSANHYSGLGQKPRDEVNCIQVHRFFGFN